MLRIDSNGSTPLFYSFWKRSWYFSSSTNTRLRSDPGLLILLFAPFLKRWSSLLISDWILRFNFKFSLSSLISIGSIWMLSPLLSYLSYYDCYFLYNASISSSSSVFRSAMFHISIFRSSFSFFASISYLCLISFRTLIHSALRAVARVTIRFLYTGKWSQIYSSFFPDNL